MNIIDTNKKGTIILSHYRSGGSQLKLATLRALEESNTDFIDLNEINFNVDSEVPFDKQLNKLITSDKYVLTLVNNPLTINYIYTKQIFKQLNEDFVIVGLKRKDKLKTLLSLGVWEELIHQDLYGKKNITESEMVEFHNHLLENKLPYHTIHLGWESNPFTTNKNNSPKFYLNYLIKIYLDECRLLDNVISEFNIPIIYYEDYEYNSSYLKKLFLNLEIDIDFTADTDMKIPYHSRKFEKYYEPYVTSILKDWSLLDEEN
tara:strand:+ start:742 stop:1524 length:783 start_codon:yes stop_codon:yes gene_type:complete